MKPILIVLLLATSCLAGLTKEELAANRVAYLSRRAAKKAYAGTLRLERAQYKAAMHRAGAYANRNRVSVPNYQVQAMMAFLSPPPPTQRRRPTQRWYYSDDCYLEY